VRSKGACTISGRFLDGETHSHCGCKRFTSKKRLPKPKAKNFAAPLGSVVLVRRDLVRPKPMGWALVSPKSATFYLDGMALPSGNTTNRYNAPNISKAEIARLIAIDAAQRKERRERMLHAVEQLGASLLDRGLPFRVTVTRVSTGRLDVDNLATACKPIVDGVAEALLFDDKLFTFGVMTDRVQLVEEQASPGTRGAKGVHVLVEWSRD
jgi:hypothetical protein